MYKNCVLREYENNYYYDEKTKPGRTVNRALPFQADFAGSYVLCFVGLIYQWPHFGLLSYGEAVRHDPTQYISMQLWK